MSRYATEPTMQFTTLIELLQWRALHQPDQRAYTFLPDGENEEAHLTYVELDRQARAIAVRLQALGASGERVLLLYPAGLEYIAAFFGCLYAGAIAVPAHPPRGNRSLPRLQAVATDAQAKMALTATPILSRMEMLPDAAVPKAMVPDVAMPEAAGLKTLKSLQWLTTDELTGDNIGNLADQWKEPPVNSDTLAFLQYTSGSTARPKGVMVSHGNLLYNNHMVRQAFNQNEDSTFVGWLPLFHDMGLIGNVLQPLFLGSACILMSPEAFLMKPWRWLRAVSRYQAHTSGGPNFAYDLCIRKITTEQRATLDLSRWKVAFNGAEPVRQETLQRFTSSFESCGFRPEAFYPCYGLAEATLFVAGGLQSAVPAVATVEAGALESNRVAVAHRECQNIRTLVSCGQTWLDQKIVIVDPESRARCPHDQVGEIWVSGPNVAQGYWNQLEETERTFRAYLADSGEGPFLRTGDLGFFHNGQLFITGRLKDLIIIGGRNHYPEDIERIVEGCHPALQPGGCAAFAVDAEDEERLAIAAEINRRYRSVPARQTAGSNGADERLEFETVVQAVRQAVAEHHDVRAHAVLLLKPASLPKTSSGKVQRHACRAGFLAGTLNLMEK